jgi:hypothetical protein
MVTPFSHGRYDATACNLGRAIASAARCEGLTQIGEVSMEALQLNAYWGDRRATALQVATRVVGFVHELREPHRAYGALAIARGATPMALSGGSDDVARVLAALESTGHAYENPDPANKSFGPDSLIATGFSLPLAPDPHDAPEAAVTLRVADGGFDRFVAANHVMISLPPSAPAPLRALPHLIELMAATVRRWEPDRAWELTKSWRRRVRPADREYRIGWLTYVTENEPRGWFVRRSSDPARWRAQPHVRGLCTSRAIRCRTRTTSAWSRWPAQRHKIFRCRSVTA